MINMSTTRILEEEMRKLESLAKKWLTTQILDHENYKKMIQQIFQRVKEATTSFLVRTIIFIKGYVCVHWSFIGWNGDQHPDHGESDTRRRQSRYLGFVACDLH